MKQGILKKQTFIHTLGGFTFSVPAGTEVRVEQGTLSFSNNGLKGIYVNGKFYVVAFGESVHQVVFPDGGQVPYPWSMLQPKPRTEEKS